MIFGPCAKKIGVVLINSALATSQAALPSISFQLMVTAFFITSHINLLGNPFGSTLKYIFRTLLTTPITMKTQFSLA